MVPEIPTFFWFSLTLMLLFCAVPQDAYADALHAIASYSYFNTDSETTNKTTGQVDKTTLKELDQLYTIDINQRPYPNLTFLGGGILESKAFDTKFGNGPTTSRKQRLTRPYADLDLSTPLYRGGIGFRQTTDRESLTGSPRTTARRKEWTGLFGWRPEGFPRLNLQYLHGHTTDPAQAVDTLDDLFLLDTRYTAWKNIGLSYNYILSEQENQITDFFSRSQTHTADVSYAHLFMNKRLSFDTKYGINYNKVNFPRAGRGSFPVLRSAGLSSLDDTPQDGPALQNRTSLIDGDRDASTGIDIGLGGDESTLTNIGVDFGLPVDVDKLYLWVDRSVSSAVSDTFSWSIYTSPDNTDNSLWTLQTVVTAAPFGEFNNRFEISFPSVKTRFIKVVVRPLSGGVPGASPTYDHIFVTEMEAFATVSTTNTNKLTEKRQDYNLNLSYKVSDKTVVGYTFYYNLREREPSSDRRTLVSNGVYATRSFSPIYSGTARVYRENDTQTDRPDRTVYDYDASLRAAYLETFKQSLTFSGTRETQGSLTSTRNGLLLRNNLKLYPGWDAFLDTGASKSKELEGDRTSTSTVRFGTSVIPNRKITLNMGYQLENTQRTTDTEKRSDRRTRTDLQVFVLPVSTVSLFFRTSIREQAGERRKFRTYAVNWSPFAEGALQLSYRYGETLITQADLNDVRKTRGPELRWTISSHFHLEMSYYKTEFETAEEKTDSRNFTTRFNITL
jgi:hypothetical protein